MSFFHVTERDAAAAIRSRGFKGGWGDLGFGVYFYGSLGAAEDYLADGGWDGELKDPVILMVEDHSIDDITAADLDPSWEPDKYTDMHWRRMDPDVADALWIPRVMVVVEDAPNPIPSF